MRFCLFCRPPKAEPAHTITLYDPDLTEIVTGPAEVQRAGYLVATLPVSSGKTVASMSATLDLGEKWKQKLAKIPVRAEKFEYGGTFTAFLTISLGN